MKSPKEIKEFLNNYELCAKCTIDGMQTFITHIRNNVAKGFFIVHNNVITCFIVKEQGIYAHGATIKEAFYSLQAKLFNLTTEEQRIKEFKKKFPDYNKEYNNLDLFIAHHELTGSCLMGRKIFMTEHHKTMEGKTSIKDFIELSKNSYGGNIVKKLLNAYENS